MEEDIQARSVAVPLRTGKVEFWILVKRERKKLKLSLQQTVKAHTVVRHRGSHIF
jgi:hypothetical protein